MRNKISQHFATAIPLVLNERSDYYNYLGTTPQIPPMGTPGSGLCNYRNSIVQFQAAYVSEPITFKDKLQHSPNHYVADPIRFINKTQTYAEYLSNLDDSMLSGQYIPLGWNTKNITPYCISLKDDFCYFISDVVGASYVSALTNIISFAEVHGIELHYVCNNHSIVESAPSANVYSNHDEVYQLMSYLRSTFKERADALKSYKANGGNDTARFIEDNYSSILVVFEDYNSFCNMTYSATNDKSYKDAYEVFLKNGKGFGVTFIAVWNRSLYSQNFTKPSCQLFMESHSGMHLGGKLDSQKAIEINMSITEQAKIRPPETGFAVSGNRTTEIFIPPCEWSEM